MQAISLGVAEKRARRRITCRARHWAQPRRSPNSCDTKEPRLAGVPEPAVVERVRCRQHQQPVSEESWPDRRRRAQPEAEVGIRLPGRLAGIRQSSHRRGTGVRRQRQRQVLFNRRRKPAARTGRFKPTPASDRLRPSRRSEARASARHVVYFGDLKANTYAVDAASGELIWKKSVDPHRFARITGSVTLHDGKLYVPVSSIEEATGRAAQLRVLHVPRQRGRARRGDRQPDLEDATRLPRRRCRSARTRRARAVRRRPALPSGTSPTIDPQRGVALRRHRQLVHRAGREDQRLGHARWI